MTVIGMKHQVRITFGALLPPLLGTTAHRKLPPFLKSFLRSSLSGEDHRESVSIMFNLDLKQHTKIELLAGRIYVQRDM